MRKSCKRMLFVGLTASSLASTAYAVTSTISMGPITFITPISVVETLSMRFGNLMSNTASTYTLSTAGTIIATGHGAVVSGSPRPGSYTITDAAGNANIDIHTTNLTASSGVTPQNPVCSYDNGADLSGCIVSDVANPGVAGKVLKVGMDLVVDGTQNNGTSATPRFGIVVLYH